MLFDRFEQVGFVEVGVDLRGDDAFVPQHLLHLTDACAPFEQVGGERVAESVGADALFDPGPTGGLLEDREDHHPRKLSPAVVQEDDLLTRPDAPPLFEVALDAVAGR